MQNDNIARRIDHTDLKPDTTTPAIVQLCKEALEFGFASVCVNPVHVKTASEQLAGSKIAVCTVIGFPLGTNSSGTKAFETINAMKEGATEFDMVLQVWALKEKKYDLVINDIKGVVTAASGNIVKVIIETCLLSDDEKKKASLLVKEAGAHFVKTSTGFSDGGATVEDISLIRETVGPEFGVKASGGIKTREQAEKMILAGATRIGTSSGVKIARS